MSKDGENRSLAQIVQEFKDWNSNLHQASARDSSKSIMDGVDQKEFMLTMHDELKEFMVSVLEWMQAREEGIPPMRYFG